MFHRSAIKFKGKSIKKALHAKLLYLSQKIVDSFVNRCIMSRVEDGADTQTSAGRKTSHLRPELR